MKLTQPIRGATRGRPRRLAAVVAGATALTLGLVAVTGTPASAAVAAAPVGIDRVVSLSGTIDSSCGSGIPSGTPVSTSIQAAVNAAAAYSQIYICAGSYTENVSITTDGIDLIGPNWNDPTGASDAATIHAASSGAPVIDYGTTAANYGGVRGLTLDGGTYGVRSQATAGGNWSDPSVGGIRNNVITSSSVAGIATSGIDTGYITDNVIAPDAGADGISIVDGDGWIVQANDITLAGSGVGIRVGGPNQSYGLTIGGASASLGNTITGGQTGVLFDDPTTASGIVGASTIQFNVIDGQSGSGIEMDGSISSMNVNDNTISDVGGSGIVMANPTSAASGSSNVLRNAIDATGLDGVEVSGRIQGINVGVAGAGNTITDAGRHGVSLIGTVVTAGNQGARTFSLYFNHVDGNAIADSGSDGIHADGANSLWNVLNTITGSGGDGINATRVDNYNPSLNTITDGAGDGLHLSDVYFVAMASNTVKDNAGDGIELTDNTGGAAVASNTVNGNANGIRVTSPTVTYANSIAANNVAQNLTYGCEDQSSGSYSNPPAVGTQGNVWGASNTGAALQSPAGICGATLVATGGLDDGVVGTAYADSVSASGAPGPYTWYSTALPAGLTLDPATGEITGTPTQAVTEWPVVLWVQSAGGAWGQLIENITITTASGMTVDATLPDGTLGTPYTSPTPTVTGGTGPYTWTATGLPAGLSIDPVTGVVSGTPTVAVADQPVTITVTDALGDTVDIPLTITILPDDPGVPMTNPLVAGFGLAAAAALFAVQRRRRAVA